MASIPRESGPSLNRITAALQHRYFLRLHMAAILTATVLVGLLVTRLLYLVHVNIFAVRYGLAVVAAYAVFVGSIKLWLAYIAFRESAALRRRQSGTSSSGSSEEWFDCLNLSSAGSSFSSSSSSSADVSVSAGGGRFGGGGVTGTWDDGGDSSAKVPALAVASTSKGSSSKSSSSSSSGSGGDDLGELILVLLVIALLVAIVASFVWIVYAAPAILSEAAFNAALAGALARHTHKATHGEWIGGVVRKTAIPFFAVLALSITLGWWAQHYCASALRLRDAFYCAHPAS